MNYLGKHTAISYLEPEHFADTPYLSENGGRLPPFIIAVGDGRRVETACDVLALEDVVSLPQAGEKHIGLKGRGRVALCLGLYKKSLPLLMVETQMGMPAVEVVLKEVLSHCTANYAFRSKTVASDAIYLIRAGSAGAFKTDGSVQIKCGEVTNATFTLGWSGTAVQSLAGLQFNDPGVMEAFREKWLALGLGFTADGAFPLAGSDEKVLNAIQAAAANLGVPCHSGANFSKDSLYAESNEQAFLSLHDKYGVISTEMEQTCIAKVAAEMKQAGKEVRCGLVSGIISILPDFVEEPKAHALAEKRALQTAAEALWILAGFR